MREKEANGTTKNVVCEYARNLYLTSNAVGNSAFSLGDIVRKVNKDLGVKVSKATIFNWKNKEGWEDLLLKRKEKAVQKFKEGFDETKEENRQIDFLANIYETNIKIVHSSSQILALSIKEVLDKINKKNPKLKKEMFTNIKDMEKSLNFVERLRNSSFAIVNNIDVKKDNNNNYAIEELVKSIEE